LWQHLVKVRLKASVTLITNLCSLTYRILLNINDALIDARSINPGIDAIWKDEMERRRHHEEENWSQITIPESQERPMIDIFATEKTYKRLLNEKLSQAFSEVKIV
jgi:hypothetical protein